MSPIPKCAKFQRYNSLCTYDARESARARRRARDGHEGGEMHACIVRDSGIQPEGGRTEEMRDGGGWECVGVL